MRGLRNELESGPRPGEGIHGLRRRAWSNLLLEPKRSLDRSRWRNMNAFQLEHADLGHRAAWRGKTIDLTASRQHPVAWNDQRHRVFRHGLTNIARSLRPSADFLRQSAIGGRLPPSDGKPREPIEQ